MRHAAWAILLIVPAILGAAAFEASAQPDGIACNPIVRTGNPSCRSSEVCRRVGGDCSFVNWLCVDNPTSGRARAWAPPFICNGLCANPIGRCESGTAHCNADSDCASRERCQQGVCTFVTGSCLGPGDCPGTQVCQSASGSRAGTCASRAR
jgi:hypothetical protein